MAGDGASYRSVLAIRDFRMLVLGSSASQMGDWLYNVALLVYVFDQTGSAGWVAAATMVRLLPFVILAPIGGVIADRYERMQVQVHASVLQAIVMCGMTFVVAKELHPAWVIALAGLNTAAATPTRPAALAAMPNIVGESGLAPGNALLHTVQDVGVVAGPAIGAAILAAGTPAIAFGVNAVTFIAAGIAIAAIKTRSRGMVAEGAALPGPVQQFVDGLRAVRDTPYVPILTILCFFGAFTYGAQTVQLVVYVQAQLDLSADGYGYLLAATGAGGVLGATVSNRLAARKRITVPLMIGTIAFVGSELFFAATDVVVIAIAISVLAGLGMVVSDVIAETAMTRASSNETLGRIFGATDGITVGAMVLGALVAAPVVSATDIRPSLVILGVVALGASLLCVPVLVGLDRVSAAVLEALGPKIEVLSRLKIFAGAPRRAIEELAKAATELRVDAGTVVVQQGDPADAFYVCVEGELNVLSSGEKGRQPTLLRRLAAPAYFGEIGLIERIPRTATVRALTGCTLLRIEGQVFLDALNQAPAGRMSAADGVIRGLARTHPSVSPEHAHELAASS
jgi:MFS family permease